MEECTPSVQVAHFHGTCSLVLGKAGVIVHQHSRVVYRVDVLRRSRTLLVVPPISLVVQLVPVYDGAM